MVTEYYTQFQDSIRAAFFKAAKHKKLRHSHSEEFDLYLTQVVDFYKKDAITTLQRIYSNYDTKRIQHFIALAKTTSDVQKVLTETNYTKIFQNIRKKHRENVINDIPLIAENILASTAPLKLRLIVENDTIKNFNTLDFELILVTKNKAYRRISIHNKETNEIAIPEALAYDEIAYVLVNYQGNSYRFFENKLPKLPEAILQDMTAETKELYNPLSAYSFEKLLFWEIIIDHAPIENMNISVRTNEINPNTKGLISFQTRTQTILELK
jgi:hypothetical protein